MIRYDECRGEPGAELALGYRLGSKSCRQVYVLLGGTYQGEYSYGTSHSHKTDGVRQAGALLATGILSSGVRTEADAAMALLGEYVENKSVSLKTSAMVGLGLAYAGSHREDLLALLLTHVADDGVSIEIASLAALSLGFIFVGSGNGEIASTVLQTLMEREDKQLDEKWARFMALGLAFLYLGEMLCSCWSIIH